MSLGGAPARGALGLMGGFSLPFAHFNHGGAWCPRLDVHQFFIPSKLLQTLMSSSCCFELVFVVACGVACLLGWGVAACAARNASHTYLASSYFLRSTNNDVASFASSLAGGVICFGGVVSIPCGASWCAPAVPAPPTPAGLPVPVPLAPPWLLGAHRFLLLRLPHH